MSSTVSGAEDATAVGDKSRSVLRDRVAQFLPAIVFLVYALTVPGLLRGESAGVYVTSAALVEHGTFAIDGYIDALAPAATNADAPHSAYPRVAYFAGRYSFAYPPGLALLATPLYFLGRLATALLGVESTVIAVALFGPLLAACVSRRFVDLTEHYGSLGLVLPIAAAIFGIPQNRAQPLVLNIFMLVALIASWAAPLAAQLLRGQRRDVTALAFGLLVGCPVLLDYGVGLLSALLLAIFLVGLLWQRRDLRSAGFILLGAALPFLGLLAWQMALFGAPWHPAFRDALDPAERLVWGLFREELHLTIVFPVLIVGTLAAQRGETFQWRRDPGERETFAFGIAIVFLSLGLFVAISLRLSSYTVLLPIDWLAVPEVTLLLLIAVLIALACRPAGPWQGLRWRQGALPAALVLALLLPPQFSRAATATAAPATNYAPPFVTVSNQPVWTLDRGEARDGLVRLAAGGSAISPWIEARPGLAYEFRAGGDGPLRVTFFWEDITRTSVGSQSVALPATATRVARFAAPAGATGLRLRLDTSASAATISGPQLALAAGVRVEPFPDGKRAALAFSFDWESAMGGLIHSRSAGGEGEGTTVGLRSDGGPSVADAEAKGLRMREGAQYLTALFARYGIHATFYATGYDLLDGNPTCQKFLDDPVYRNANQANGWGSDWWRTHPWYGDDPCKTEATAPAWYFASETRTLAAAGHEIASHTFGHLYVRGVSPAQLQADLELWNRSAEALGLPPARTFAFPWTSSNSLDAPFWAVFAQEGMTTLTRLYPPDLRHPYELDRIKANPNLVVFPDFYLASNATALDEALARIDITVASRGYHSLWDHPNEVLEQNGQVIWQRVVDYAVAQREQGLWIAPVGTIADYGVASRQVAVTAIPVAGGMQLIVENRSGQRLTGVTLGLPVAGTVEIDGRHAGDSPVDTTILPTLEPGAQVVVLVRR